ncbi:MAG: hypothetical protein KJO53_09635, partial [Eudoraea sp.]|nr:hypothetical protein [Eudoraea sp.]
ALMSSSLKIVGLAPINCIASIRILFLISMRRKLTGDTASRTQKFYLQNCQRMRYCILSRKDVNWI